MSEKLHRKAKDRARGEMLRLSVVLLTLLLPFPTLSQSNKSQAAAVQKIRDAIGSENYKKAFPLAFSLAQTGNAEAQSLLGGLYLKGSGVKKDRAAAIKWIRKAAEHGHALSQRILGLLYEKQGNFADSKKQFVEIKTNYPNSSESNDIEKYIARVDAKL